MLTAAAEVEAELEQVKAGIEQANQREAHLRREILDAERRHLQRRRLDVAKTIWQVKQAKNESLRAYKRSVDEDVPGGIAQDHDFASLRGTHSHQESVTNCKETVSTGTLEWEIAGMSWLKAALHQAGRGYAMSPMNIKVGGLNFKCFYCPESNTAIPSCRGSTCNATLGASVSPIQVHNPGGYYTDLSVFRYRFYIMRQDGEYVLWGDEGQVCRTPAELDRLVFGPDVSPSSQPAAGIFGLQHKELLQSEWVINDTLIVKIEFQVRPYTGEDVSGLLRAKPSIEVPAAAMSSKLLSLFDGEKCSDVTFKVKGESIKAHSQILAAQSYVFERQFFGGLQESVSKEVVMEDMEPKIFKGFLKFLYTDDLEHIRAIITECLHSIGGSSDSTANTSSIPGATKVSLLQDLLAMSHKYQVERLLAWCQQQLCGHVTEKEVCSVLCQAHLCEARDLEAVCLSYIKEHMNKIAPTNEFARLTTEWPELLLKISLHAAGVSSQDSAAAVSVQQEVRKRKREQS